MNPFHTLSDEQLAEWHMLRTKCDRLERDLVESRKATEAVQAAAEEERVKLRGRMTQAVDEVTALIRKHLLQQNLTQQAGAALVETLGVVRRLMMIMRLVGIEHVPDRFANGWRTAITAAEDVLTKHDVPW